jgi:hypothetical protein
MEGMVLEEWKALYPVPLEAILRAEEALFVYLLAGGALQ